MRHSRLTAATIGVTLFLGVAFAGAPASKTDVKTAEKAWGGRTVELATQKLKAGAATIALDIDIPRGYHFAPDAPTTLKWKSGDDKILRLPKGINAGKGTAKFPVIATVTTHPGQTEIVIDAAVFICENGSKLCQMDNVRIKAPVEISTTGAEKITLSVDAGQDFDDK